MYKHHFRLAFRDITKNGFYSIVIIFSLAIGLTCSNYITAFLANELSVDAFHNNKNRIYRLLADDPFIPGKKMEYVLKDAPQIIKNNYPEVDEYCQNYSQHVNKIVVGENTYWQQINVLIADKSFLNIFSYPFLEGNPAYALDSKDKIVITRKLALKYFGNKSAIDKNLILFFNKDTITFKISGVIEDVSYKSHLNFDMIVPIENFKFDGSRVYLLLKPKADVKNLEKKFSDDRNKIPILNAGNPETYSLQNLMDIYFDRNIRSSITKSRSMNYIFIAGTIGILIVIISILNYLNLLATRLNDKKREFGINKILGSNFNSLLGYFLVEFGILIFIAFDLSIIATKFFLPYFNKLTNSSFNASVLVNFKVLLCDLGILILIFGITLISISLSIKKQRLNEWLSVSNNPLVKKRNVPFLVIFQFVISIILIISGIAIARQLSFIYHRDIGIDREVIELRVPYAHKDQTAAIKNQLLQNPLIESTSVCAASPLLEHAMILLHYDKNDNEKTYSPCVFFGDEDFMKTLNIKLLAGREFSAATDGDRPKCIINKSLATMFQMDDPIGQKLPGAEDEIIGLVEDFNFQSLEESVAPGYIAFSTNKNNKNIILKINPDRYKDGLSYVKKVWNNYIPDYPFEYSSMGDQFDQMHAESGKFFRFIITFTVISLIITMVGLLALTVYSTRIRTKEIGIRKVNGAKSFEIMTLITKENIKFLIIAMLIAFPAAYYIMNIWLKNFVYRINLTWWIFASAVIITFILVFFTIFGQSWRAANRNPVEALRYE